VNKRRHRPRLQATLRSASFFFASSPSDRQAARGDDPFLPTGPTTVVHPDMWFDPRASRNTTVSVPGRPDAYALDETEAVQFAFDSHAAVVFRRDYSVTRVTLTDHFRNLDGAGSTHGR
jgi:hypothetical protein